MAMAMNKWWAEVLRSRKARKAVLMWKHRALSKAFESWYEYYILTKNEREGGAELERLKKMMARMALKKWLNSSLGRAWNKWRDELRRTRLGKKVAQRWARRTLGKGWRAWEVMMMEKKRLRAIAAKVVAHWKNRVSTSLRRHLA